jgi:hypothetical protein
MFKIHERSRSCFTNRNFLARIFAAPHFILKWQKVRCSWNKKQWQAFWILRVRSRLEFTKFFSRLIKGVDKEEQSFIIRQEGQTCTSAIPPNKRPVDNTLHHDGELCLKLSVGKASVMIFIEELACTKNCVLRLPLTGNRWNDSIRYLQGKINWWVACEVEETYL